MKTFTRCVSLLSSCVALLAAATALAESPPKSTPELLAKGKASFTTNCLTCHGEKGDGNGPAGKYMSPKPRDFAAQKFKNGDSPEKIFSTIATGLKGTAMPQFDTLPAEERWGLVYHVLSLKKAGTKN